MKKITGVLLILFFSFIFSGCSMLSKNKKQSSTLDINQNNIPTPMLTPTPSPKNKSSIQNQDIFAAIKTNKGEIIIKLYSKEAPKTVANFLKKIDSSFYNNLIFHRVVPDFVIQGGDPLGNGTGGGKITSEINSIPFKRGSIGLARGPIKEVSNDSQFYICLEDESCSHLTNEYVNFGEVVSGMEVVDSIQMGDKILEITSKTK